MQIGYEGVFCTCLARSRRCQPCRRRNSRRWWMRSCAPMRPCARHGTARGPPPPPPPPRTRMRARAAAPAPHAQALLRAPHRRHQMPPAIMATPLSPSLRARTLKQQPDGHGHDDDDDGRQARGWGGGTGEAAGGQAHGVAQRGVAETASGHVCAQHAPVTTAADSAPSPCCCCGG